MTEKVQENSEEASTPVGRHAIKNIASLPNWQKGGYNTNTSKKPNMRTHLNSLLSTTALTSAAIAALSSCTTMQPTGGDANIDPDARAVLQTMSDKLSSAGQFSVRGTRKIDPALLSGRKVSEQIRFAAAVTRPNKIAAISTVSDGKRRAFVYDGSNVTLHDIDMGHYATVRGGRTIDRTIDILSDKWGFQPPLADLLVSDPFASLTGAATGGKVVGTAYAGGTLCDHIAVTQEGIAWDIWVARSDRLPRKFAIAVTTQEGCPKVEATFTGWNLNPKFPAAHFEFTPPEDAVEIDIAPAG